MHSHMDFFLALYDLVILTIRTWIVYNRDLKMGVFLSTLVVVSFAANFTVEALFMETLVGKHLVGCRMFNSGNPLTKSNRYSTPSIPCSGRLLSKPQK